MLFKKEHELLRKSVRDFVDRELKDIPEEVDTEGNYLKSYYKNLQNINS